MDSPKQKATLVILRRENQILLGMKKRGFGEGKWNGIGGKPNHGESIIDTAKRELNEEVGVIVESLDYVALLHFNFEEKPEWNQSVYVFFADSWDGEPTETEEMKPQWFDIDAIPYDSMWEDDAYWLPKVLEGKKIEAHIRFGNDQKIISHSLEAVDRLLLE